MSFYQPEDHPPIHDLKRYYFLSSIEKARKRNLRNSALAMVPLSFLILDALHFKLLSEPEAGLFILWWLTLVYREYRQWRKALAYRRYWVRQKRKRQFYVDFGIHYRDVGEELNSCLYQADLRDMPGPLTIERGKYLYIQSVRITRNLNSVIRYFIAPSAILSLYMTQHGMPNAPEYACLVWIPFALHGFMAQRTANLKLEQWYNYYHYQVNQCYPLFDLA